MTTSGTSTSNSRYFRLIEAARARTPQGYVERHHVLPRCKGGSDAADNLVRLTAREHFLAHWLLYRMYKDPATARAFKLMVQDQKRRRGRDYASARECMAVSMRGDLNVARREDVRAKLKANCYSAFAGKKRPEHAQIMRDKGLIAGDKNPFFGTGARQQGAMNHMAVAVIGKHKYGIQMQWATQQDAADALGVTIQAVCQSMKKQQRSKGWSFERAV